MKYTSEDIELYEFMVNQYADAWVSLDHIQADYSGHLRRPVYDPELKARLAILDGFFIETRGGWYQAQCTLVWSFYLPDVMYFDPGAVDGLVQIDPLSLMKHGDLLVRRSDGEIVPVDVLSFWADNHLLSIQWDGDVLNEDGLTVIVRDSSHEENEAED